MSLADDPPMVVVVSGPSGAGKDTVLHLALELDDTLATVATAKTRAPRPGEVEGVHHVFLSEAEFDDWLARDAFLEHASVYGHRSGVPRQAVAELLRQGKSVVLRTDVQGARSLKAELEDALLVFITAPDVETLRSRIASRGAETGEEIAVRLAAAEVELREAEWFDAVIVNQDGCAEDAARTLVERIREARRQLAMSRC